MITDAQVESALHFLRDQAANYGRLVGQCKYLDHKRKVVRAQAFLSASVSGTVAEREAHAETSPEYIAILDEIRDAETERATLQTNLERARITIDAWRSMSANQRHHV